MPDDVDARAAWLGFQQLVFSDPALQRLLQPIEDWDTFTDVVVRVAKEHGFHIDRDFVRARLRETRPPGHRLRA